MVQCGTPRFRRCALAESRSPAPLPSPARTAPPAPDDLHLAAGRARLELCLGSALFLAAQDLVLLRLGVVPAALLLLALLPLAGLPFARRGRRRTPVRVGTAGVALHGFALAWVTGGADSPALPLFATLPLLPALFRDHVGTITATVATLGGLALLTVAGGVLPGPWPAPEGDTRTALLAALVFTHAVGVTVAAHGLVRYSRRVADALADANARLAAAHDHARAADAAKTSFLAAMSHELRTPLNAVLGVSGMLLETPLDARQREQVEQIRASTDALVALVDDLLDFGRIEAGELRLETAPFEPVAVVLQVTDLLRVRAREKALRLDVEVDPRVPARLIGDGGRFRQVLFNLVGNAVKYTDRGSVIVRVTCPERDETGALLRIAVEDTGIGIAPDDLDRIFQRFTQVGGDVAYRAGGTGLGLAITRLVVDRMGGRLHVRSALGEGSTFTVELRLPVAGESSPGTADLPRLPAARVLLADDDPVNRKILLAMLDRLGCVGDVAGHGEEALRLATAHDYDVVLLDVEMPGTDGYTVARRLRDQGRRKPILAITGHTGPESRRRAEDAGMDDVLHKPLRTEALHHSLAHWLGAR